jgi:hypothetical protein
MIFYFHYNKPLSKKLGKPQLSLHFKKTCHVVDKIICGVKTYSHNNKRQPYIVIKGDARDIQIVDGCANIS